MRVRPWAIAAVGQGIGWRVIQICFKSIAVHIQLNAAVSAAHNITQQLTLLLSPVKIILSHHQHKHSSAISLSAPSDSTQADTRETKVRECSLTGDD